MSGRRRRLALVANPDSGPEDASESIATALLDLGADVERLPLGERGRVDAARHDRLVVAGGDGSVGCCAEAAAAAGLELALVPTGTANDFARHLALPTDRVEAARLAATGTRTRPLDIARMGDLPFVNAASAGLNVPAARRARGLKRALGPLAYFVGALGAGLRERPVAVEITCDDTLFFAGRAWQVIVANSGAFGAGSTIATADPQDGLLDVVVVPAGPRRRLVRHAYGLRRGHLSDQAEVRHRRARRVVLRQDGVRALNVDGEVVMPDIPAVFTVVPSAVRVVVPEAPAPAPDLAGLPGP